MQNRIALFRRSIARIQHVQSSIVGAGFLVSDRHIITCAHVVTAALSLPANTTDRPDATISLDFPLRQDGQQYTAIAVGWHPVSPGETDEDIAVLELASPQAEKGISMLSPSDYWNHPLRTFGFPKGHDEGVWATGSLRDQRGNGWIQMDSLSAQDRTIEPGFSGAPIWDEQVEGVVGMAVAAEKRRQDVSAAYLIPTDVLKRVWTNLQVASTSAVVENDVPDFKQIKLKVRQQHEALVVQRYEAAWNQLNATLSESDKVVIREQVRQLETELQKIAAEIQQIRAS